MKSRNKLSNSKRLRALELPTSPVEAVLDTDTFNEIDDQFAITYALLSPDRIDLKAIYAAPFLNRRAENPTDGMEKSYQEILNVLKALEEEPSGFVFKGSAGFLKDKITPINSAAASHLIKLAHKKRKGLLYVIGIGALTNIASAILLDKSIIHHIVVVWLGGNAPYWSHEYEFNLAQDRIAVDIILESGVPLIQVPAKGVSSNLVTTLPELKTHLSRKSGIGRYLLKIFKSYRKNHYAWGKVIWDLAPIAWIVEPQWVPSKIVPTPRLKKDLVWSNNKARPPSRLATWIDRNKIFADLFRKIESPRLSPRGR